MTGDSTAYGRVAEDGTVYVRTRDGERPVGQWLDKDPDAGLAFYAKRYDGLAVEVGLLEQRLRQGAVSPEDAASSLARLRGSVASAQAVGDLDGLRDRLDAVQRLVEERRRARREERAEKSAQAKAAKETIVAEAERIAAGTDWRGGANRLRDLLTQWKSLPRIDRASDDVLWHRFSAARTSYTRRRKHHFAEQAEQRDRARVEKEKLAAEAEALSASTEWGATARAYRDLMARWKAAGPAPKDVDDALWQRFRGAQDSFFRARDESQARQDAEFTANAKTKLEILTEAEKLLPVRDPATAREAFRALATRWDAAGKVPRSDVKDLEGRFRRIEEAVRQAEDDRWRRSNPEAYARASETVTKLEASIAALEADRAAAQSAGDDRRAASLEDAVAARRSWLAQAQRAAAEFGS